MFRPLLGPSGPRVTVLFFFWVTTLPRALASALIGIATLRTLRQIVQLKKKMEKSKADINFLTTCIMYNLTPKSKMVYCRLE